MRKNLFEDYSVSKGYDTTYVVSTVAIATQNFKCNQFRDSNVAFIAILPYLIAVRVGSCTTCGTSIVDLRAGGIPDVLPPLIILEQIVDALVKERTGNKLGDQHKDRHNINPNRAASLQPL